MSKKEAVDLTGDDPVPAPPSAEASAKRRRIEVELGVSLDFKEPARGPSARIAQNEKEKEVSDLKRKLEKQAIVETSLFNKLEKMEKRADKAESEVLALKVRCRRHPKILTRARPSPCAERHAHRRPCAEGEKGGK